MWHRRAWLTGSGALAAWALIGCRRRESRDPAGPSSAAPSGDHGTCRAPVEIGYGAVQAWRTEDPSVLARLLADAGATLSQAELSPGDQIGPLARWISALRARGITAWVVAANWNDPGWHGITVEAWRSHIRSVLAAGPDWLEAVAEPDERALPLVLASWEEVAVSPSVQWVRASGFTEPAGPAGRTWWRDIHYCDLESLRAALSIARPDVVHAMDCSPLLASRLAPGTLRDLVRLARDHLARLLLYDTFGARTSPVVLGAIREGLCT